MSNHMKKIELHLYRAINTNAGKW